ncbi:MAG: flavin reductase family protein [Burkholderiaceae bacterium]|nr:flavin reductase family protein [Burkholderiaceae bacterium]
MPPHSAPDSPMLRRAFGCFPTGVTVVTTRAADGSFAGLTVNSYTSLSLDPPLVLWALGSRSASLRVFEAATHFAINILAEDQAWLSRRFATKSRDKFHGLGIRAGIEGVPLLDGCSAHIECRMHSAQPGGDHLLFVGKVERVDVLSRSPLLYVGGRYRRIGLPAD